MNNENFNELYAFITIAKMGSFTKAALRLGVSSSALSHTIKGLEKRLGIRLLARTTRSVSTTEAGEQLLQNIEPLFSNISQEIKNLSSFQDKPKGIIRINSTEYAAINYIYPKLPLLINNNAAIKIELHINNNWVDIVSERFDMGVRLGNDVEKDMIATRIAPDMQMVVVGSTKYFSTRNIPRTIQDLADHVCIGVRISINSSRCSSWEFNDNGKIVSVLTEPQLIFNHNMLVYKALLDNVGLAWLPLALVEKDIKQNKLISVLSDYQMTYVGHHIYYPNRKQNSPLFKLIIDTLRYKN